MKTLLIVFLHLLITNLYSQNIIITEIMTNPADVSDANGEYFELYNAEDTTVNIDGWTIKDLDETDVIDNGGVLNIPSHGYLVIGRKADTLINGGVPVDYEMVFGLTNSIDEIIIYNDSLILIDSVAYNSSFPLAAGASMYFSGAVGDDNNTDSNWVAATQREPNFIGEEGDYGSPGTGLFGNDPVSINESKNNGTGLTAKFKLHDNYPNPFNPNTFIKFEVPSVQNGPFKVVLTIYNLLGQKVKTLFNGFPEPGQHTFEWRGVDQSGSSVPSGIYIYQIESDHFVQPKKMLFLK